MKWWLEHKFRMIQNNIRDIDGNLDVEAEVATLKNFGANVLQIGCGGISAFTPSNLDSQIRSPYLNDQMFKNLLEACHENNIHVIARFDVSKTHEKFLQSHPEWFSRSMTGDVIRYNDTVATCLNGEYQQLETLKILREVLSHFNVDGIFFNMFGYQTFDYDNHYVGICQCNNCKTRFSKHYGEILPTIENISDPIYQKYLEFKQYTVKDILFKIRQVIAEFSDNIALSTYSNHHVDIIRTESNSAVNRPYPFWIYSASDNTANIEHTFSEKVSSNCAINAVDIPYRFMGVSPTLNQIRLYQNMANGSNLDWCIIGAFTDYPDRLNYNGVKEIFHFQQRYQQYFDVLETQAKILLVQPKAFYDLCGFSHEYRGLFKILKETHLPFKTIVLKELEKHISSFDSYSLIILPGIDTISSQCVLDALQKTDAIVVATETSLEKYPDVLKSIFSVEIQGELDTIRGSYLVTEPKQTFKSFSKRDWVYLDKKFTITKNLKGEGALPLVRSAMYGPPERCFGHEKTDIPGVIIAQNTRMYFPWPLGTLYYDQGYEDFKNIFLDLVESRGKILSPFITNAHNSVEIFFGSCGEGQYLLQMINLSGFNGTSITPEIIQRDIEIQFRDIIPQTIFELTPKGERNIPYGGVLKVDNLGLYKAFLIKTEGSQRHY